MQTPFGNPPAFGFPAAGTAAPQFQFSGAANPSSTTGVPFGGTAAPTSAPAFGLGLNAGNTATTSGFSFAPAATAFGGFNTGTTTSAPSFGFGMNPTSTTTGFSFAAPAANAFGTTGLGAPAFGTQPQAAFPTSQNAADSALQMLLASVSKPQLYNDDRDLVMAKWNKLQAAWGIGKGYFASNAPPFDFTLENPFCYFKTIGFSCLPTSKPEDGLVSIVINRKESELQSQQITDCLHKCFGSRPNITVHIEGMKGLPNDETEVVFYLSEHIQTEQMNTSRRVTSPEVCRYLEQATIKSQLAASGVSSILPKMAPSKEALQHYLNNPPAGIQPLLWNQARRDNPDPDKLVPVPLLGFAGLTQRTKHQENETKQQQRRLEIISNDIEDLHRHRMITVARIAEHKRRLSELQHRLLKVLVRQEISRKMGYAIEASEEQLRIKLEAIQNELSAPTQVKCHLKEMNAKIRMSARFESEKDIVDGVSMDTIKMFLLSQQEGIALLLDTLREDEADLKTINEIVIKAKSGR